MYDAYATYLSLQDALAHEQAAERRAVESIRQTRVRRDALARHARDNRWREARQLADYAI